MDSDSIFIGGPAPEPLAPAPSLGEAFATLGYHYGEDAMSNVKVGWELRGRYSTPPLAPIPVSERLPGAEDCHPGDGWCWAIGSFGMWMQIKRHKVTTTGWKAWLPHWAIPLPGESQ